MKNLTSWFLEFIGLHKNHVRNEFVTRKEMTASEHLSIVPVVGENVFCEKQFTIYNGHKNIQIGNNVYLTDSLLNAGDNNGKIIIEDFVFFGHRVQVLARSHDYLNVKLERQLNVIEKAILIKEGAWIGSGSIILPGVIIGKNSVIGAGSVVTKNVPDYCVFAGNPAKLIKRINYNAKH